MSSKGKDIIYGIVGLAVIGIIFPPLFMVLVAIFGVGLGLMFIGWCYRKFVPKKFREEMRKAQRESVALSKERDKWFWELPRYHVGRDTYLDISGLPSAKGTKASWMAGKHGLSVITKYMRETGKWEAILKANGMFEQNGQVYKRTSPYFAPPPRPKDDEPDDVELAAVALMMEGEL